MSCVLCHYSCIVPWITQHMTEHESCFLHLLLYCAVDKQCCKFGQFHETIVTIMGVIGFEMRPAFLHSQPCSQTSPLSQPPFSFDRLHYARQMIASYTGPICKCLGTSLCCPSIHQIVSKYGNTRSNKQP